MKNVLILVLVLALVVTVTVVMAKSKKPVSQLRAPTTKPANLPPPQSIAEGPYPAGSDHP